MVIGGIMTKTKMKEIMARNKRMRKENPIAYLSMFSAAASLNTIIKYNNPLPVKKYSDQEIKELETQMKKEGRL